MQLGTNAPHVVGLVYIAAFAPDEGETGLDLISHATPTPGLGSLYPDGTGYIWLTREGFVNHFASGVNHVQATVLSAGQKPINSAVFGETFGPPAWRTLPSWYLIAENDVIHPNDQHFFAARMGATTSTIASGHLPMISKPNKVADFLIDVVGQLAN
jgi:pimeloyl-ACP methyl ester carboxylesterase